MLPGISTEQLRSRLNRMVADGLLTRQRYREVPPRVDYELTERSRALMPVIGALARWGYDWTWSAPRPGEDINVGAVFRLAPGLIEPPAGMEGSVDLLVEGQGEAPERRYRLTATRGRVEISESAPDEGAGHRHRQPGRLGTRARARRLLGGARLQRQPRPRRRAARRVHGRCGGSPRRVATSSLRRSPRPRCGGSRPAGGPGTASARASSSPGCPATAGDPRPRWRSRSTAA